MKEYEHENLASILAKTNFIRKYCDRSDLYKTIDVGGYCKFYRPLDENIDPSQGFIQSTPVLYINAFPNKELPDIFYFEDLGRADMFLWGLFGNSEEMGLCNLKNFPSKMYSLQLHGCPHLTTLDGDLKEITCLTLDYCGIKNFDNCPVIKDLNIYVCPNLEDVSGLRNKVTGKISFGGNKFHKIDFQNVDEFIKWWKN